MIREEEYLTIWDFAQEQGVTTDHINISELSRETGYDRKTIRKLLVKNKVPRNAKRLRRRENSIRIKGISRKGWPNTLN
jgi:transposase